MIQFHPGDRVRILYSQKYIRMGVTVAPGTIGTVVTAAKLQRGYKCFNVLINIGARVVVVPMGNVRYWK